MDQMSSRAKDYKLDKRGFTPPMNLKIIDNKTHALPPPWVSFNDYFQYFNIKIFNEANLIGKCHLNI